MDLAAGKHPAGLGAYALGALGLAEGTAVQRHAARCPDCRRQLDEFADVTNMLDRVPLEALMGLDL